jgi:hypothetical protein
MLRRAANDHSLAELDPLLIMREKLRANPARLQVLEGQVITEMVRVVAQSLDESDRERNQP